MDSKNWIGGEWIVPSGKSQVIYNPSNTKEEVGTLHYSSEQDVLQASDAARRALANWSSLTGPARGGYLYQLADKLEKETEGLATIASCEMGKPISEMRGEVARGVQLLRYYAAEGVRAIGQVVPSSGKDVLQYTKRVPLGVVGIITPWNFPVAIPIWKIAPALICGNTVIWKPAENASLTATRIAELFEQAGFPAGVLNLAIGKGSVIGTPLIEQAGLDAVSFTGSTGTGKNIASTCAKHNIKYQTEMGGKNAAIVLRDADLDKTVPVILSGAFRSAGQKCTATSRIIVEQSVYEPLVERLQQAVSNIVVGHALSPDSYLGPVASTEQFTKVSAYAQIARDEAQIIGEGKLVVDPTTGHYVTPLVVTGVKADHKLVTDEIFGPVAAVVQGNDFEETLSLCNQTEYGLSASLFTNNLSKALRFLDSAEVGMVRVNQETAGVEYQAPFGGMKWSSSHTREQGQAALDFYSQVKTCALYYGMGV